MLSSAPCTTLRTPGRRSYCWLRPPTTPSHTPWRPLNGSTGSGAAGLVGGALMNEAFDDDEPDVVVNNYYED
jgi:hypothetical protein